MPSVASTAWSDYSPGCHRERETRRSDIYNMGRSQFDAKQQIVKDEGKDSCGEPPASYWK